MSSGLRFSLVFVVLVLLVLGVRFLVTGEFAAFSDWEQVASALFSITIVGWMLSGSRWRGLGTMLRRTVPWLVLVFALFGGYVFRRDLAAVGQRLMGALLPHAGIEEQRGSIRFVRSSDGHFHIQGRINGVGVLFLADTGASDIILDRRTAARVGIDVNRLRFSRIYETANGQVRGAPVRLDRLTLGSLDLERLPASVNESPMAQPLLGMSFFNRLDGFEVRDDTLTLHWKTP
ncbi:MAG: TIGR02281 family clan AA aspartic protease [Magnetococcales bacterium]|nr:TIGR02281 family clan AA aspartic protease [Magnetococcales bacterium]